MLVYEYKYIYYVVEIRVEWCHWFNIPLLCHGLNQFTGLLLVS